jgi:adenylate cyclase
MRYQFNQFEIDTLQFKLICADKTLAVEPKDFDLLVYLVKNRHRLVTRDEIFANVWQGHIVGEATLSNHIKTVRKILGDNGDEQSVIATLRGRGYQFVAETQEIPHSKEAVLTTPAPHRRAIHVIIALLVIGIGYFIWDRRFNDVDSNNVVDVTQVTSTSIAVLPFVNMSSDPEQEYFSDGISEEILNVLAKIPNLHVTSRSSSFAFKGESRDLKKVAKQLGVNHILEGSVRKSGTKVRITAQLIEAVSDRHLWSETYDRELTDVFAIQDELSAAIVAVLKIKLMGDSPEHRAVVHKAVVHKVTPEAHTAYLKGLYYLRNRKNDEDLQTALKYFDDAIKLDNNYALAHTYRGLTINIITRQDANLSDSEGPQIARKAIDRAIEIDPELARAYVYRALNKLWFDFDFKGYRLDLELAKTLNPNIADFYLNLSSLHSMQGNHQQALLYAEQAKSLDPMNRVVLHFLAEAYFFLGDYQKALLVTEDALTIIPNNINLMMFKTYLLLAMGNNEQALLLSNKIGDAVDYNDHIQAMVYSKLGDKKKSDATLAKFIKNYTYNSAWQIALTYCFRDEIEQCLDWLDMAYQQKDPGLLAVVIHPFLKPVYQEKRYKDLVLKMGILQPVLDI